jgi:serine/threonine protein kinase/Tfp pilus assembly protein PilF
MTDDPGEESPKHIGPYKVLQVLGEGGMGVVYEAEQTEPVTRRVALKIIKLGMDTKEVVARFEAERQALAVMDHPGIATVLDAGATESGRPYFVMELEKGVPLTEYCDLHKLPTSERLALFIKLCHAIQHAHQKGVIHRDLKPSNILIVVQDSAPQPKVIDFGVAKAIGHRLTDKTLVTQHGQAIGTPVYMSPEQLEMSGLDVDTRTDIYALGVILYELLVGTLPYDFDQLGTVAAIPYLLREQETPTPSSRLKSFGDEQGIIAKNRHTVPSVLKHELEGDLDWIVLKAMEKDRTRRYETANGLALDIQRHLNREPVLARPPSTAYRMSRFVARNRPAVAAAAAIAIAVIAGSVVSTVGMVRATRAEAATAREAEALRQVSEFLVGLFEVNDPGEARGNAVTARELLDSAAQRIDLELAEQPRVQAQLMLTMGEAYESLGLYNQAAPLLERGLALRETVYGEDHVAVAEGLFELAEVFRRQGKYGEAERLYLRAVTIQESLIGPAAPALAATLNGLGNAYLLQGKFDEAEPLLERGLAIREGAFGADDQRISGSLASLGTLYIRQGRYEEADSMFSKALVIRENALGRDHPDVVRTLRNLGGVRWERGNLEDADRFIRRALDISTRMLGPDHPELGSILNNLGVLAWTRGEYREAASLYDRALTIHENALGPSHYRVAGALNNIAETHWKLGNFAEGEDLFRRALIIKERVFEPQHPSLAITLNGLANLYRDAGRYSEAEPLYRRALSIREAALGEDDRHVVETLTDYAAMLREAGRPAEAAEVEERVEGIKAKVGN